VAFSTFVRFELREPAVVKVEVLAPALAFWAGHFLTFFDDVAFSVADDADHFDVLTFLHPLGQRAIGYDFSVPFESLQLISLVIWLREASSHKTQFDELLFGFPEILIRVIIEIFRNAESFAAFLQQ
jgi:hypothetical protein